MAETAQGGGSQYEQQSDVAQIPHHVWEYAQGHDDLAVAAREIRNYLEELAERASIRIHTIESRAKSLSSYQEKSQKLDAHGLPKYSNPTAQIHDCVAARVIVFTTRARDDLADLLSAHTSVVERTNPGDIKHNGYDSEHLIISGLIKRDERDRFAALSRYFDKYYGLEIQIRSVAGHAWAEYEHDIRYKSEAYKELSPDGKSQVDQWFFEAGGMRRFMDELFGKIEAHLIEVEDEDSPDLLTTEIPRLAPITLENLDEIQEDSDPRTLDESTLSELISLRFPAHDLGDARTLDQLLSHLRRLGVLKIGDLEAALANVENGQVARLMDYPEGTSGARRLDDELLATFTDKYVDFAEDEDRKQFLKLRLRRVRGKFALYSIGDTGEMTRPMPAASAMRELARIVASSHGTDSVIVDGAISNDKATLPPSAKARLVRTVHGQVFVTTNVTRARAEEVMDELVLRAKNKDLKVFRAGDLLFEFGSSADTDRDSRRRS